MLGALLSVAVAAVLPVSPVSPSLGVRPLADLGPADRFAVAGSEVLYSESRGRALTVRSASMLDASAPKELLTYTAASGRRAFAELAGSGSRIGAVVQTEDARTANQLTTQLFLGPSGGPFAQAGEEVAFKDRDAWAPIDVAVAGSNTIVREFRKAAERFVVVAPDGARRELTFPEFGSPVFAGDWMAFGVDPASEEDPPRDFTVESLTPGGSTRTSKAPRGIISMDLREDGALLIELDGGGVRASFIDGTERAVSERGANPQWAGDHVVFTRGGQGNMRLQVADPDGTIRDLGPRSTFITDLDGDASGRVAWRANDCLVSAAVTDGPVATVPEGPCVRTEMRLGSPVPEVSRRPKVALRCIAAVKRCQGTVVLRRDGRTLSRSRTFTVELGKTRRVPVTLTRSGLRALRRSPSGVVLARVETVDPGGRTKRVVHQLTFDAGK